MIEIQIDRLTDSTSEIRIIGINRDKTRKTDGIDTRYDVYFELSRTPDQEWRKIFEREWKALNLAQPRDWFEATVDNKFLIMHCFLEEVAAIYLPALKKAVESTNREYDSYTRDAALETRRRMDVWAQERKAVDDMADPLRFV